MNLIGFQLHLLDLHPFHDTSALLSQLMERLLTKNTCTLIRPPEQRAPCKAYQRKMPSMQKSSRYSLQKLPRWHPFNVNHRRLIADDMPLPTVVNGDEIGLELTCGEYTVLATSFDYFDGCQHWIYLLNRDGRVLDLLSMPDEFGFIKDVEIISPNEVAFGYFRTDERWNLVVQIQSYWSYAPRSMFRRLNRFLFNKRHLEARCIKAMPCSL